MLILTRQWDKVCKEETRVGIHRHNKLSVVLAPIAETPPVMAGQPSLTLAHVPQKTGPATISGVPAIISDRFRGAMALMLVGVL